MSLLNDRNSLRYGFRLDGQPIRQVDLSQAFVFVLYVLSRNAT